MIVETTGQDSLTGSVGGDEVYGLDGNDTLNGGGGGGGGSAPAGGLSTAPTPPPET